MKARAAKLEEISLTDGLLNSSYLYIRKGDYRTAIEYARKVTARYSGADDEALGDDGFDLQVVKALSNEATRRTPRIGSAPG